MVKIRLRRIGTKARPFYRVVVAKSSAGRNGQFVEIIGTYDPLIQPKLIKIDEERALHWLNNGAQPTETTAYLLNKTGILEKYFQARPNARKNFSYLDKRTAATSVASVVEQNVAPVPAKAEAAPVAEPAPEPTPEPEVEAAAPEAPAEEPAGETAAE